MRRDRVRFLYIKDAVLNFLLNVRLAFMSVLKRAKIYSESQVKQLLNHFQISRYPLRNKVILLLSVKAGLRACEIAGLQWQHVLNDECTDIADCINITDKIAKGQKSGRNFSMSEPLRDALRELYHAKKKKPKYEDEIILNQQGYAMDGMGISQKFCYWFRLLKWKGYSSHSGRRTFITNCARKVSMFGGSIEDVRDLAGHTCLSITQKYIEKNPEMIKRLVNSI